MVSLRDRQARLETARLYAIVDTGYVGPADIPAMTSRLVEGGVDLIQLRAKNMPEAQIEELGREMRAIIPAVGPLFILNDFPALAELIFTDGVHVGQDDLPVAEARRLAGPEMLVGKSTHSLEQAMAAEKEGADYIGVGPIFATPTKPDYVPVGLELIEQVRARVRVPQFFIGGVNEGTLPSVLRAGACRVVIVSALLKSGDVVGYCRRVRTGLEELLNRKF